MKKIFTFSLSLLFGCGVVFGQEHSAPEGLVSETFHGSMGVNLQTVMHPGKKTLSYRISHRFGDFDSGVLNLFGFDGPASIYMGFDYGIKDNLTVSFGRNSINKLLEGSVKWTPLRQSGSMPISLGLYGKSNLTYAKDDAALINGYNRYDPFSNRMGYITQLMVARKFGDRFSLQISPTWVHQNLVETNASSNDIFAVGAIAEYKFGKKTSISGEYSYVLNKHFPDGEEASHKHEAGLAYNIRTGGHIFQIVLVNSFAINEGQVIPYTGEDWFEGKFRIGFNIMRSFWL